jgi:hypothetical protein
MPPIFQLYRGGQFYWWRKLESPEKTHRPAASHWQHNHISCIEYTSSWAGFKLSTLVVIGIDCIDRCKSNYHMITTMMTPTKEIILSLQSNVHYSVKPVYKEHWRQPAGFTVFAILLIHVKFSEVFQLEKLYNNVFNIELSNLNATDIPP